MKALSGFAWILRASFVCLLLTGFKVAHAAPHVLVVGDSLSAEYGLKRGTGWVPLLSLALASDKLVAKITNASISGETTSGGAQRIDKLLADHKPQIVIIELGGNDALRGLALTKTEQNLRAMVQAAKKSKARVLLLGMQIPPNYGPDYSAKFAAVFKTVADTEKIALVPFFLAGVGDAPNAAELFQNDRIHPNEKAQARMMQNVLPALKPLLSPK
jgi:acyl-CoA thioesterase I